MRSVSNFNEGWVFHEGTAEPPGGAAAAGRAVRLPHTAVELPFNYFDERAYQRGFTYRKVFRLDIEGDREAALIFDGAMADAVVRLNGEQIARHRDGYTPFEARLNGSLRPGDNLLTVTIDGSENPDIPPFGGRIDYLTYAGIYRDVWLRMSAAVFIDTLKIETPDALADEKTVRVRVALANPRRLPLAGTLTATLEDAGGAVLRQAVTPINGPTAELEMGGLAGIALWGLSDPRLYTLRLRLATPHGQDETATAFGFRTAEFTAEGFFLNGRPLKLRGLNRHQSFPYVGYALGRAAQERDAEILKQELKCNIVRTSHYPQSPWFLDHCDRIGLLVFEEIPGWQHIGGAAWKKEAVENVGRMIRRDWNHPSIVLWGVRINESQDDHAFYTETNRVARELDASRQTGGVRYITDSEMLEDVYTMNDFILGNEELPGANRARTALRPQEETTGLKRKVPYLVTEFSGHMYPTKSYDQEQRQAEHVRRHLEILNAAYGDRSISGAIGWCAFDYNTHKDFGSGDRICHHGVMDMFREPKPAAYVYRSQCEPNEEIVLKPVTFWARGERNIGGVLPLIVLTNCEEVELRYGAMAPKRITVDRAAFPHLPRPPAIFEHRHFSASELGMWGMLWEPAEFIGYVGGRPAVRVHMVADPVASRLEVAPDRATISAAGRECLRVMVRVLDQAGNKLPFFQEAVGVAISGPARLIGPSRIPLQGGATGLWLEAEGAAGTITITVRSDRLGETSRQVEAV